MVANDGQSDNGIVDDNNSSKRRIFSSVSFMDGRDRKKVDMATLVSMNQQLAERGFCISKVRGHPIRCRCLEILSKKDYFCTAVANYQLTIFGLETYKQKTIVMEWLDERCRGEPGDFKIKYRFRIPFLVLNEEEDEDDSCDDYTALREARVCHNAMMDLLARGRCFWTTCIDHYKKGTIPSPRTKNTGQVSNRRRKFLKDYEESLKEHFEELQQEAEPVPTSSIRLGTNETGGTDTKQLQHYHYYLPSTFTLRGCYAKYCFDKRKMRITTNKKGSVFVAPACAGGDEFTVPSWSGYVAYWKVNYPNLKVRKPFRDMSNH
ncbi:hypothetical protein IV203_012803 [Nitzschia inconspicua]|uniref:Uncharacterized protein n=1 Tax=Nitzschia inconspicua TaxID=303405 RepID=A0A9K3KVU3_9STRA|nr:hypothetical protein IV203_012746 [Nitzschia inconspicua]KAG7350028.1 hypothetical protein IV203_012625 [Nitzschia inconspicua]KAG7373708.1 hypothetical protein IV203_012803 [Nitzschia inconspicua]